MKLFSSSLFIAMTLLCSDAYASARIKFSNGDTYDIGKVKKGAVITATANFTNTGDKSLLLNGVSTSCSCIKATWPSTSIPPGGRATLYLKIETKNLNGGVNMDVTLGSADLGYPASVKYKIVGEVN